MTDLPPSLRRGALTGALMLFMCALSTGCGDDSRLGGDSGGAADTGIGSEDSGDAVDSGIWMDGEVPADAGDMDGSADTGRSDAGDAGPGDAGDADMDSAMPVDAGPLRDELQIALTNPDGTPALGTLSRMIALADGDFLLAGSAGGPAPAPAMLIRVSPHYRVRWARTWGTAASQRFSDVLELADGDLIAVGYTGDTASVHRAMLFRVSGAGSLRWARLSASGSARRFYAAAFTDAGNIVVVGSNGSGASRRALSVHVTPRGSESYARVHSISGALEAKWIGAGPGSDMIVGFVRHISGTGGVIVRLTSIGTVRRAWNVSGPMQSMTVTADGVAHYGALRRLSRFDTETEHHENRNMPLSIDQLRAHDDRVMVLRLGSSFTVVNDALNPGTPWKTIYTASAGAAADCVEDGAGALHCATNQALFRLADPAATPQCRRSAYTSGLPSTTGSPSASLIRPTESAAGTVLFDAPGETLTPVTLSTMDVCPP